MKGQLQVPLTDVQTIIKEYFESMDYKGVEVTLTSEGANVSFSTELSQKASTAGKKKGKRKIAKKEKIGHEKT